MDIQISYRERLPGITSRELGQFARAVLKEAARCMNEPLDDAELSLSFVGEAEMAELNQRYRSKEGSTDVLSFTLAEEEGPELTGVPRLLGDIVVSLPNAQRQAVEYGHTVRRELAFLLIHGFLHLLGEEHEGKGEAARHQAQTMKRKEKDCIARLEDRIIL